MSVHDPTVLPENLPVPLDDGACAHLVGAELPSLLLASTEGGEVDLRALSDGARLVLYLYPRTGRPGVPLPDGWDAIPGARGCTPQSCGFRDHHDELRALAARVAGLSSQTTEYQREAAERLHLPFPLLSDPELRLARELGLPTFEVAGEELYKRVTLVARDGAIENVFYPVFPPDRNAAEVLAWISSS